MSHQTGITANEELMTFFGSCRNGSVRAVKVSIEDGKCKIIYHLSLIQKRAQLKFQSLYAITIHHPLCLKYLNHKRVPHLCARMELVWPFERQDKGMSVFTVSVLVFFVFYWGPGVQSELLQICSCLVDFFQMQHDHWQFFH